MKTLHIPQGMLKAYLDGETQSNDADKMLEHLDACSRCRSELEDLRAQSRQVEQRLNHLASGTLPANMPGKPVSARFMDYRYKKENQKMFQKIFAPRYRTAWLGISLALLLGISMAFPSVRAIANSFLGLFRVQSITIVQVNPGNLPEQLRSSADLQSLFTEDLKVESSGEPTKVSNVEAASEMAGFQVRLPSTGDSTPQIEVMPGGKAAMKVDLAKAQSILNEIGRSDIQLPQELDGAEVSVEVPNVVTAVFGDCSSSSGQGAFSGGYDPSDPDSHPAFNQCTVFTQLKSPIVNAPEGLDIAKIGEAMLELMGMKPEEAAHFSQNIDWTTTLVIPLPQAAGATFQDLPVDDVMGTLILQEVQDGKGQYLLLWVKDGIVYALGGPGNATAAARIASTLK